MNGPQLIALPVLSIEAVPACAVLHLSDYDREVPITGYAWLYRPGTGDAGERWTLIDTGMCDPSPVNASRPTRRQWQSHSLLEAMARHGVTPDAIDRVILTHLHLDHCGGLEFFHHARWYVPAIEWDFARNPANADLAREPLYSHSVLDRMATHDVELLADGDRPAPGLRVQHTGGHTPGSIALELLTPDDQIRLVLAGDVAPLYDNLRREIPPGTLWHWGECRRVLARWSSAPYPVLPNHDSRLFADFPEGVIFNG